MNAPEVDTEGIAAALATAFPDLEDVAPCTVLGWGFGSVVVETAGGLVFRVARIAGLSDAFEWQQSLLEVVAPRVPVAVPRPRWLTGPCGAFPHGVMGYPKVPGRQITNAWFLACDRERLANSFAEFMAALHAIPPHDVPMLKVRTPEGRATLERSVRDDVMPVLREQLEPEEFALAEAWWERYLGDPAMMLYAPCVTHGDLWWGNVLVDDHAPSITGVLDWELAYVADPARDFAGCGYLGEDFMVDVLGAYAAITGGNDEALAHRTRRVFEVREFYGLRHAAAHSEMRELEDALEKVRRVIGATA